MVKKNLWLILAIIAFITLILSIYMSYNTGKTEYAWIIGFMLFGIGCGSRYNNKKKKFAIEKSLCLN
ncbi:TPA: hypothetical protein VA289_000716 [Streptococcus agalactiae]|nr:hypothetical protein [Streptococcus agalactiae]